MKDTDTELDPAEAARRRDEVVKRMLATPPQPRKPRPAFSVRQDKNGAYVVHLDPDDYAPSPDIEPFESEADAKAWISNESADWLKRYEASRSKP